MSITSNTLGQSNASNLITQERGADVHWYGGGVNRFEKKQGWATTENYIEEDFDFPTVSTSPVYGTTIKFELDKRGHKWVDEPILMYNRSACAAADIAVGIASCDYEGYSAIQEVRYKYGNDDVIRISGEEMYRMRLEKDEKERAALKELVLGGLTLLERQHLATEAKQVIVPIPVPWAKANKQIAANGLPNKVYVEVEFRQYQKCFRLVSGSFSGTAPTLSNIRLRQKFVHLKVATANALYASTKLATPISHKVTTVERQQNENVLAGVAQKRIALRNLKNNTYLLRILLRRTSELADNAVTTRELHNYYLPFRVWLEDSGQPITNYLYPWKQGQMVNMRKAHPDADLLHPFTEIHFADFKWIEASEDGCFGGRTLGKYNNPEIIIDFARGETTMESWDTFPHFPNRMGINAAGTGALYDFDIEIESLIHNIILENNGDLRRYLK